MEAVTVDISAAFSTHGHQENLEMAAVMVDTSAAS
jgi:hypothetical protein